jgi:carbonic anhydrase
MFSLLLSLSAITAVLGCPDHDFSIHNNVIGKRATPVKDWAYEASYNWGMINSSTPSPFPPLESPY